MVDTWALAEERFGAAGTLSSTHHILVPLLQGGYPCPPSWVGPSVAGQIPQDGGCSLHFSPKPPRGERPLAWGLFCSPWGSAELGQAGCSCAGAQGGGNQRQPCGPHFHLWLQRGTNKLCPCARRQQLPPRGPSLCAPSLLLLPGKPAAPQSQGHPTGAPTCGHAGGKGMLCRAEGGRGLWSPPWARLGAGAYVPFAI